MAVKHLATVRLRLTLLAVLVVGIGLLTGAAIMLALVRDDLTANARTEALERARAVVPSARSSESLPEHTQVVARDGTLLASTTEHRLLAVWPDGGEVTGTVRLPPGEDFTVAGVPATMSGTPVAVYSAVSLLRVTESLDATTSALVVIMPALLGAAAVTSWVLVGRALRTVEAIRNQVADITASRLDRRVPEPAIDDEVGRLAKTMNEMLGRLQTAQEKQVRFAADAAHELRSPLANVLARLEIALAHPAGLDWVRVARQVHRECARLSEMTDELLVASRADDAGVQAAGPVDLDEVVLAEVEAVRSRGRVTVELSSFSAARLHSRADQLRRVARNLLDNAERHAASRIQVCLTADERFAELVVADDGPGIPRRDREVVFERFVRLQPARDRDSGGSGLGLAIVREVALDLGGRVWVADSSRGAEFHVRLPLGHHGV